jgi:hypothetical protein
MEKINIIDTEVLSDNWYTLKKVRFEMTRFDGAKSILEREAYDREMAQQFCCIIRNIKQLCLPANLEFQLLSMEMRLAI